jgi:hypothetical protein
MSVCPARSDDPSLPTGVLAAEVMTERFKIAALKPSVSGQSREGSARRHRAAATKTEL